MVENKVLCVPAVPCHSHGSTFKRDPLKPGQFAKSTAVASWLSTTGFTRSLPTNIRDIPRTINNNSLRSKRAGSYTNALPEGGKSYSARVNTDNFVEERRDKTYTSGSAPTVVRCQKMYQTEYIERTNEALPQYRHDSDAPMGAYFAKMLIQDTLFLLQRVPLSI